MANNINVTLLLVVLLAFQHFQHSHAGIFSKRKVLINALKFSNCGGTFDPVRFNDVQVSTTGNGDLEVSGQFYAFEKIEAPVKAVVKMKRKVLGMWIPVFLCINDFGSCTFEDVCKYGRSERNCPPLLEEHDVPCECPIETGAYRLPGAQFNVNGTRWASLLAGTYRGNVRLYRGDKNLACYNADFRLE